MKNVTPMITSSGERYDIPDDQRDAFAADFGDSAQPVRMYRTADGDYNIPESQAADFVKDFPDAKPVRTIQFAGGEKRSFDPDELQKFLSEEYVTSPAYKADRDEDAQRQKDKAEKEFREYRDSIPYEQLMEEFHGDEMRLRKKFYEENRKADSPFMAGLKEFGREYHANLSAGANAAVTPWSSKVSGLVKEAGLLLSSFGADKAGEAVVDVGRDIDRWTNILFRPDFAEEESTVMDVTKKGVGIMSEIGSWYAALKAGGPTGIAGLTLSANANSYVNLYDTAIERGASPEEAGRIATLGGVGDAAVTLGFAAAPVHRIAKAFGFSGEAWAQSGVKKAIGKGWSAIKRAMGIGAAKQMLTNAAITTVEMGGLSAASGAFDEAMRQEAKGEQLDWDKIKDAAKKSGVKSAALGAFLSLLPTPAKINETIKAAERTLSSLPHSVEGREILKNNAPDALADFLEAYEKGGAPSRKQLNDVGIPDSAAPTAADRVKLAKLFEMGGYKSKELRTGKVNPEGSIEAEVVSEGPAPAEPAKGEVVPVEPEPVKQPEKPVEPVKPPEKPVETTPVPVEPPKPPAETPKNGPVSVPPPEGTTTPPPPAEPPQAAQPQESATPEETPPDRKQIHKDSVAAGRENLAASANVKKFNTGKKGFERSVYTPTDGSGSFSVNVGDIAKHSDRGEASPDNMLAVSHIGEVLDGSLLFPEHTEDARYRMAKVEIDGQPAHVLMTIVKGKLEDVAVLKGVNTKREPAGTNNLVSGNAGGGSHSLRVTEGSIADFDQVWQAQFKQGIIDHNAKVGRTRTFTRDEPPPAAEVPAKTETGGNQGDAAQQLSAVNKGKKPHAAAKPPPEPKRTFVDDFGKTHEVNEDISRQLRQEARSEVNLICNTKNKTSIETARKQVKRVAASMTNDDLSASLAGAVREERRNTTGGKASDILLEEAKSRGLEVTEKPKEMPQPGEWIVGRVDGDSSYAVAGRVLSADARGIVVQYYGGHNKVRAGKTVGEETFKALVPTDAVDLAIRDPSRPAKVSARSPAVAAADDFIVRNTTLSRDGAAVANDDINHQGEVKPPPRTEDEPRKPFAKPLKIVDAPAAAKEMAGHASQDVTRKALTGVHVEKGLMVATDGRHMVIAPAPKGWTDGEYGADGKPVGDDRVYPNWRQVVPDVKKVGYAKIGTVANGDAATDAVDFASALRKKVVAVTKYDNDGPTVAIGDATCDPSYVSDILGTMFRLGAKSVDVWHRDGKSPVVFKGRNADGEITSVLMPLRSNGESAAERGFTHVRMPLEAPKPKNKGKGKKSVQAAKALGSPDAASPLRPAPKGAKLVQDEFDGMGGVTESVSEATRQAFAANPRTKSWEILAEPKTVSDVNPADIAIETPLVPVGNDGATVKPQSNNAVRNSVKDVFRSFGVCENAADRNKVVFPGNSAGKMMSQSGADVAALAPHMKQLFESAVPAWYEPETTMDGHTPHPDVAGYRHYLNKFRTTDGSEFYIRFTVREGKGKGGFKGVHAATVSDVKIYESKNAEPTILVDETSRRLRAFTDNKLSDFLSTVNAEKTQKTPDGRAIRPADLASASEAKDPAADPQNAARNPGALRDPAFVKWAKSKGRAPTPFARRAYDAAQLRAAVPLYRNVFPDMNIVIHDRVEDPAKWTADHPDGTQKQISGIYTGSAADYEKPSLHAVGTGEGSQVYGWGLYGSTVRGVAEGYARPNHLTPEGLASSTLHQYSNDRDAAIAHLQKYVDSGRLSFRALTKEEIARTKGAIEILKSHAEKSGYLYEQTFFTNRAEGDESHLLKWYEPVSEEQLEWVRNAAEKEGVLDDRFKKFLDVAEKRINGEVGDKANGESLYLHAEWALGSPQAASEFLARAGIDGVKYPVDSYGGKSVKDGDKAGWNYVSFRDDNIRVDHKWRDGEQLKMIVDPKSGETLGWYTPQFKEVHLNPGATVETLAHEMLHAAQDWAKTNSPKLAKTLDDIARDCPPKLRQRILRAYGVVSPETIMKEWGAFNFMGGPEGGKGRGGEALRDELAKRENAAWLGRFWSAAKDAWRDMAAKMGGNRIDLDAIDSKTPQEAMDFLARAFAEGGTVGKANPPGKSVRPAIDMTKPLSFGEKWDVNLHDYRSPLKWLRDEMAKRGSSFADDTDFYEAARLQKGYDQAAVNDADRRLKEYTGKLKKLGVKHEEVVEFMQAQAAKDRNAMIREKFGREDGSGMTDAEAAATLKAFDDAGKGDALREISDFLLDMQREGLQYRVETGLLSAEDAQRMADREPFHVPFRSAVDPETGDYVQWGSDKALEKAEFKEAKGRKTLADDVVGWMFSEFIDAHTRGNENRIRKMVADAMRLNAESGVGKILKGARKQSAYDFSAGPYKTGANGDGLTGDKAKTAIVDDPRFRESRKNGDGGRKNVLAFKEGGRTHYIEFAEGERGERLQAAVNGRDLKSMGKLWKRGMRFWSSTATEWAPTFALRNFAADNIDVFGNYIGEHGIVKGSASYARHLKNAAALTPAITRYIATGDIPQGVGGEWIRRYEQSGGLIAGYASEGYGEITSKIDAEIAKGGRSKGAVIARNVALAAPRAVAAVNRYAELLTRVSAFRTQCENGMTDHKAALWSRESTVDFNEKGNFTGITNGLWMFSNSTLGASARQLKSIFKSKYGWQTVAAFVCYGLAEGLLEALMNGDDEEREAKGEGTGKDVSEYTRANSLYWRRGGKVYRIPFHAGPFSYIKYAGNCAARIAFGKMKPEDAAKELGVEAVSQLFHYTGVGDVNMQSQSGRFADDAATFAGTAAPSLAQPLVQGAFNIDYAGRSIYNEGFPGDETPRSAQGRRSTPGWAKDAAAWLNEATRSEGHETGYIDLPPEIVKMAGEAVGKNLLRDVMNAGTVCAMAFGDEKFDVRNVPVARDFVRAVDGNDRRYNDARKEYEANADYLKKHAREMSAEERRAYVEKFPHAAFVAKGRQRLDGLETEIRRLRKMEDGFAFVKGKAVPREWPEERLEAFRKRRRELQALFLKEMGM